LGVVNQFASNPSEIHWTAAKRILRYLKGTSDYGICFDGNQDSEIKLSGFVDADWGGDAEPRRSQSGYVYRLCGGPVMMWLRLLEELGYRQESATVFTKTTWVQLKCQGIRSSMVG